MYKKKIMALLAVIAVIGMTGCQSDATVAEETTLPAATVSATTTVADTTKAVTEETTTAEVTTTEETTTTAETTTTVTETEVRTTVEENTAPAIDYSNFSVADYCGEFDNAKPVAYTIEEVELTVGDYTSEQEQAAIEAIKATDDYAEVISLAKEMFTYDNGTFTPTADYAEHFMTEGYINYMTYADGDFAVTPIINETYSDNIDGTLLIYSMPLPESKLMSSRSAIYYMVVYVNTQNEAIIIPEVTKQFTGISNRIDYVDGVTHIMFETGASQGTQQNLIYSFDNTPKCEYAASYVDPVVDGVAFVCNYNREMLFRDEVSNSYCNVAVVDAPAELVEIILNAEAVNEAFPDIKSDYEETGMRVLCGKYIQACGTAFTFENGVVTEYKDYGWVKSRADGTNYNVRF